MTLNDGYYAELALRVGRKSDAPAEPPAAYLERIRTSVLSDRVAFFFQVQARWQGRQVVLEGAVERAEFKVILREVFHRLGFAAVSDRVEVLPDLARRPNPFGVVTARTALTASEPDRPAVPMDEALYGEPVYLLKELPSAFLIKTLSGYWGYAPRETIRPVSRRQFLRHLNGETVFIRQDCGLGGRCVPSGSRLVLLDWGAGRECLLLDPHGESFRVSKARCQRNTRRREMERVVAYAQSFLNAPYNFGGKNGQSGIDCSGLIQLSFRCIGLNLARDAKQQYLGGNLIPPYLKEALLPGDVLFFMNGEGQVDHAGLYQGRGHFIHAQGGRVRRQSLTRTAPDYFPRFDREFIGAKRFWW